VRVDLPPNLPKKERAVILAALREYAERENAKPNPWMLAGRATVTRLGALQIRHAAVNQWDARFHPFSPVAPETMMGRGDSK
jgi:hypothetical protein